MRLSTWAGSAADMRLCLLHMQKDDFLMTQFIKKYLNINCNLHVFCKIGYLNLDFIVCIENDVVANHFHLENM